MKQTVHVCYIIFDADQIFTLSRGKMEHGGKMEHRVFWKKHARRGSIFKSTWFLSSANSASYMEIKLAIDHILVSLKNEISPFW